jgi:hypothetical protein
MKQPEWGLNKRNNNGKDNDGLKVEQVSLPLSRT